MCANFYSIGQIDIIHFEFQAITLNSKFSNDKLFIDPL